MKVRVATDSGGGFTKEEAAKLGIDFLPLQVTVDDKNYLDGIDLEINDLYDQLAAGKMPTTSLPPLGIVEDLAEKYEKDGVTDLVLVTLSNGLSSTNSAVTAAMKSHGINVHTTDIYSTLGVERLLAEAAAKLAAKGAAPDEIIARINNAVDDSAGYLICSDLNHLSKGGRLTPMAARLGGLLKIKPVLEVSKNTEGKVDVYDKVRTMSKAVKKAAEKIAADLTPGKEYNLIVLDSRDPQDAQIAEDTLKELTGAKEVIRLPMYSVIASHTGLEAVGLQYVPKVEGAE